MTLSGYKLLSGMLCDVYPVNSMFTILTNTLLVYEVHSLNIMPDPLFWIKYSVHSQIVIPVDAQHTEKINKNMCLSVKIILSPSGIEGIWCIKLLQSG